MTRKLVDILHKAMMNPFVIMTMVILMFFVVLFLEDPTPDDIISF